MTSKRSNTASAKGRDIAPGVPAQKGSVMEEDIGRVASQPGSQPSASAASASSPIGADPSREPNWPLCGYAPGWYMGKCHTCGGELIAAKRATQCLPCAVDTANLAMERLRTVEAEREAYREQAINRGWNWKTCNLYGRDEYERRLGVEVDLTLEVMMGRKTFAESLRDSDGSGEADKTGTGLAEGDSAGPQDIAQGESA